MCAISLKAKVVGHSKFAKPTGAASPHWKGYGEISAAFWYRNLVRNAKIRGRKVEITIEYMWNLFLAQNRKCALTGWELTFSPKFNQQTASIDRIDSSKDYVEGNVRWVHKHVNKSRQEFTDDYFLHLCEAVVMHVNNSNGERNYAQS